MSSAEAAVAAPTGGGRGGGRGRQNQQSQQNQQAPTGEAASTTSTSTTNKTNTNTNSGNSNAGNRRGGRGGSARAAAATGAGATAGAAQSPAQAQAQASNGAAADQQNARPQGGRPPRQSQPRQSQAQQQQPGQQQQQQQKQAEGGQRKPRQPRQPRQQDKQDSGQPTQQGGTGGGRKPLPANDGSAGLDPASGTPASVTSKAAAERTVMFGDDLDQMLADRYEREGLEQDGHLGDEAGGNGLLLDEDEGLNDETFGDSTPLDADFDFSGSAMPGADAAINGGQKTSKHHWDGRPMTSSEQRQQNEELLAAQQQRRMLQMQAAGQQQPKPQQPHQQQQQQQQQQQPMFGKMPLGMPPHHVQPPQHFHLAQQHAAQLAQIQGAMGHQSAAQMQNLRDIEAQMFMQRGGLSPPSSINIPHGTSPGNLSMLAQPANAAPVSSAALFGTSPGVMSMADVEAAIRAQRSHFAGASQLHPGMAIPPMPGMPGMPGVGSHPSTSVGSPFNASDIEAMMRAQLMAQRGQLPQQSPPMHHPHLVQSMALQQHQQQHQQQHLQMQAAQLSGMPSQAFPHPLDHRQLPPIIQLGQEQQVQFDDLDELEKLHEQRIEREMEQLEERMDRSGLDQADDDANLQHSEQQVFDMDDFPSLATAKQGGPHGQNQQQTRGGSGAGFQRHQNQRDRHRDDGREVYRFGGGQDGGRRNDGYQSRDRRQYTQSSNFDDEPVEDDSHLPRQERYSNLMRKHERELIARIQISALVPDDPLKDDFYCEVFTMLKKEKEKEQAAIEEAAALNAANAAGTPEQAFGSPPTSSGLNWQQSLSAKSGSGSGNRNNRRASVSAMTHLQQQMKRLIETRKHQRPREATVSLVGALGKIAVRTTRTPKQAIQVTSAEPKGRGSSATSATALSASTVLKGIEAVYTAVLSLEHLKLQEASVADDEDLLIEWDAKFKSGLAKLWASLRIAEPMPFTSQHPFVCFLNYPKGSKVLARAIRFLTREQVLGIFSTILQRFECLDVSNIPTGTHKPEVETFMANVVPLLVSIVSEAPLVIINSLMRVVLERHNMVWFAKNRAGLALLTMFLSRAEILKQVATNAPPPSEQELGMWSEIYAFLFQSVQGHFASLFPTNLASGDELYVWQFLAAMAVGASGVEHQRVLVTEVRENVIHASRSGDPKALDNVNLFLNALGLGISAAQLAAMPI
ncbi:topoisomerase II-associated protein PAT1-domain-containing protein [Entophlyctis helioformis]|nr:topoisomerase II-associated protein PAT1-domain-containing protein [Entophlyctis helioformis]